MFDNVHDDVVGQLHLHGGANVYIAFKRRLFLHIHLCHVSCERMNVRHGGCETEEEAF